MKTKSVLFASALLAILCALVVTKSAIAQTEIFNHPGPYYWDLHEGPVVADLDLDGQREIIDCSADYLYFYRYDDTI